MSQPATKKLVYRGGPLPQELRALTVRVAVLEEHVKEMRETIYGLYGLQGTVRRLDSKDGD